MATGWWVANTVTPSPFAFTLTMGTPVIEKTEDVNVTPAGFDLTLGWGTPVNGLSVSPAPIDLTLNWGTPVVIRDEVATPAGMNLTLAGGTPEVISTAHQFPTPAGVNLGLTWGTPVVTIVPPPPPTTRSGLVSRGSAASAISASPPRPVRMCSWSSPMTDLLHTPVAPPMAASL
ncbi:hypothetical protein Kostya_28 [Mycobacterium phage Kostya]|uniref:Uncharacterized protein n=1 Tax=Mycobacterium phage Kostya TaxID=2914016 RepID=B5A6Z0_9CAUD|nr:hypothetical protein Kostya_28 [Mycobacterium phage Kostya]ACF34195.1 hypothetical protein Kostya_28 [Mycobacterium phage Kostya]